MYGALVRFFRQPPPTVRPETWRIFLFLKVGTVAGLVIHVAVSALFWALGVWPLVLFNAASLLAYAFALFLNQRGYHVTSLLTCLGELVVHQALCVYLIGWDAGFQLYLLAIVGAAFYLPRGTELSKLFMLFAAIGTYVWLFVAWRHRVPSYPLDQSVSETIGVVNAVAVFALMALLAQQYNRAVILAETRLAAEHARAEALLRNVLPDSIAKRLKAQHGVIADRVPEATILFADIVGFTPLAEHTPPEKLVSLLNDVFSEFDDLVVTRGVEKIKTIGDAYMVAAGIPERCPDHAAIMADLALEMLNRVSLRSSGAVEPLRMRIGMHTGPVIAGVIGKHKFIYDLWGDNVNTAARMESHGLPGEIQVTAEVAARLDGRFELEDRGLVEIKGKGRMRTFFLKGRVPGGSSES